VCSLLVVVVISPLTRAQTVNRLDGSEIGAQQIDTTVMRLIKAAEVPGAAIAILNRGHVVYERAYGFRDTDKELHLTPDSVMSAASFTKVAFAYMMMQLVKEGQIDLDKPVYQYLPKPLPEYSEYVDLKDDPRYRRITARMLLSHTTGFPNLRAFEDDHKLQIHFEPGTRFAYSGEGINLLQLVVETITKKNLEELMQERVFRPLGMTRTSMVWKPAFESDYANGYDEYGRSLGPEKWDHADAAGSMQTTVRDFARFLAAVMRGEGLDRKAWQEMLSPQIRIHSKHEFPSLESLTTNENDAIRLSYGLGWGLFWTADGKAFFKEGHDVGWRNYTVGVPEKKIGIVIMTNSANGEGIYKEVLESLLHDPYTPIEWEGFTPYDMLPPRQPLKQHHRASVDPTVLEKYVGRYSDPVRFPGVVLTIRREGDHLSGQENDEPPQDLLPESAVDFYSTNSADEYTFAADGSKITLRADGKGISLPRVP
jgi:CubicO group peptidase (beta-lactamase class C family)